MPRKSARARYGLGKRVIEPGRVSGTDCVATGTGRSRGTVYSTLVGASELGVPAPIVAKCHTVAKCYTSIAEAWHALFWVRPGAAARQRSQPNRVVTAHVLESVGGTDVVATQISPRRWTIRVQAPAGWRERIGETGLAERLDAKGRKGLVLDYKDGEPREGYRTWWVLRQPHPRRNRWAVVVETEQL